MNARYLPSSSEIHFDCASRAPAIDELLRENHVAKNLKDVDSVRILTELLEIPAAKTDPAVANVEITKISKLSVPHNHNADLSNPLPLARFRGMRSLPMICSLCERTIISFIIRNFLRYKRQQLIFKIIANLNILRLVPLSH